MPWATMLEDERALALEGIRWAMTPEGAQVDLDLAVQLRGVMRKAPLDDDGHQRAWLLAARLIVGAAEIIDQGRAERAALAGFRQGIADRDVKPVKWIPISQEPLVLEAQRSLQAVKVAGVR